MQLTKLTACVLCALGVNLAVHAEKISLFAISQGEAAPSNEQLEDLGCAAELSGSIIGQQGSGKIIQAERFSVYSCRQSVLTSAQKLRSFEASFAPTGHLTAFEGSTRDDTAASLSALGSQASIVVKISHYNNLDPVTREGDLAQINALASQRPNTWSDDGLFNISSALGAQRPDELVILHYASDEAGAAFRKNNKDVLPLIGAFNKSHLDGFVYLNVRADEPEK